MSVRKTCIWGVALVCLVMPPSVASATDCLGYLSAERSYENKTGKALDHDAIEQALTALPPLSRDLDGDPWQRYIDASNKLDWAVERQQQLYEEDARQQLLGNSVPNFNIRASTSRKSWDEAFDAKLRAADALDAWFVDHGIGEHASSLIQWFVGIYRQSHDVSQIRPPDLVFRVAVHERRTNCP